MHPKPWFQTLAFMLLGAFMMSFAWPVRGQFGHAWGAMITGACAGSIFGLLPNQRKWQSLFPQATFLGILGFVIGGENLPYGALINQILAQTSLAKCTGDLLIIFFIGSTWGAIGSSYLGYAISETPLTFKDFAWIITGGIICFIVSETTESQSVHMFAIVALLVFLHLYNFLFKHSGAVSWIALAGFIAFGLGFLISIIILYLGHHGFIGGSMEWWRLRDQIWGGFGGLGLGAVLAWLIQKNHLPHVSDSANFKKIAMIVFLPLTGLINTYNVYEKWYLSGPPTENTAAALSVLITSVILLTIALIIFAVLKDSFWQSRHLNKLTLISFLTFTLLLSVLAAAKSIVYDGWPSWETAFTLFIISNVIFISLLPFIALRPQRDSLSS